MSKILVNEIGTQSGTDVAISSGKTITGTASQFKITGGSSGQVVKTDGSGGLSFGAEAGKLGQVVSTILTTELSTTSATATPVTGLAVTITPVATSSKILIMANGMCGHSHQYGRVYWKLSGGNTATYIGAADTGHEGVCCVTFERAEYSLHNNVMNYLDSPSTTSATTYQVHFWQNGGTAWVNRPSTRDANGLNGVSTITALEILA